MTCYHSQRAWRSKEGRNPDTGKWPIVFNEADGFSDMVVQIPCGKCVGCLLDRSKNWAIRCVLEASLWPKNCFITLTYAPEHLPDNGSLVKEHFTLFMKRLRKKYGEGIRFFQCGEYGSCGNRPHYHACLFNFDFPDKVLWKRNSSGSLLYRSPSLEKLWPYGFSTIGEVTIESAAYVARYVIKKMDGVQIDYGDRLPEYVNMSRRPGIAHDWFQKYCSDVYPIDFVVINDKIKARPPRYFDNLYDVIDADSMVRIRADRRERADKKMLEQYPDIYLPMKARGLTPDSDRLDVRERVQKIKLKKLKRGYEDE